LDESTCAREAWSQERGKAVAAEERATGGRRKENGVNPASSHPIYRGVHGICLLRFLPPYNMLHQVVVIVYMVTSPNVTLIQVFDR
jgi:hypothetical protein